jgi:hypothetical protein
MTKVFKLLLTLVLLLSGMSFMGLDSASAASGEKGNGKGKNKDEVTLDEPTITRVDEHTTFYDWSNTGEVYKESVDSLDARDWEEISSEETILNPNAKDGDGYGEVPINDGSWFFMGVDPNKTL